MKPWVPRAGAVLLALIAWLDPAVSSMRTTRPIVSVITTDAVTDANLEARLVASLDRSFTVVRGAFGAADGVVTVGTEVPDLIRHVDPSVPLFAVSPDSGNRGVVIEALDVPARSPLAARVAVGVRFTVTGGRGRVAVVSLRSGGMLLDRRSVPPDADAIRLTTELSFVPDAPAMLPLDVTVRVGDDSASARTATDVIDPRWQVHFVDTRPSWASTFVRRALEADPRFRVTSRTTTSRAIATTVGDAPAMSDADALRRFDVLVVGAPDDLSPSDLATLDRVLRTRGGTAVLLLEREPRGALASFIQVGRWAGTRVPQPRRVGGAESGLLATDLLWPRAFPLGATGIARTDDSTQQTVVWSLPVGAGRLIVSGALNAWHYRAATQSGFDRFWTRVLASAATAAPAPVEVRVDRPVLALGETSEVQAILRDVMMAEAGAGDSWAGTVEATVVAAGRTTADRFVDTLRLWPAVDPGVFTTRMSAPADTGVWRVAVQSDRGFGEATFLVSAPASRPSRDERAVLSALSASRRGSLIEASQLAVLRERLGSAIRPAQHVETWYPMRSPLWIIPFAIALGAEWWWRRRRGLA
jgi:hypothetical protein